MNLHPSIEVPPEPYKGRELPAVGSPIRVYRNLNAPGVSYSVRVGGLVVARAHRLRMTGVRFITLEAGRRRALRDGQRNVHAFADGLLGRWCAPTMALQVSYRPETGWAACTPGGWVQSLAGAAEVWVWERGCWATGLRWAE